MAFEQFAKQQRLKLKRDNQDDTVIVPGHEGHLFDHGNGKFGVMIVPKNGTSHRWTAARKAFLAAGLRITQNGDMEGVATFDPDNPEHVRLACKYADVRSRRKTSPAQIASLAAGRALARPRIPVETPVAEAVLAPRNDGWVANGELYRPD